MKYAKGSIWRKWDLHFHTPSSPDYINGSVTNEDIITILKENEISLVAITDHHTINVEGIKELKKLAKNEITILPGVEFCSELGGSESVHFIGIFPEDSNYENIWLKIQGQLYLSPEDIKKRGIESIYCDLKDTSKLIHELGGVVTIHAGRKSNTLENITNALSSKQALKIDTLESIDIFEIGQLKDIEEYKRNVYPNILKHPPMVLCSDNHDVKNYYLKANCWIKADPTFLGLRQLLNEPFDRVHVGEYPPIFERIKNNKTKYIKSIYINKLDSSNLDEEWFNPVKVDFNPKLISVIGNKGSGKSALLDTIGLTCDSKNFKDFSFLSNEKFRDSRNNKSKHFFAQIEWESAEKSKKILLSENPENSSIEKVKYVPQKYLEGLCSDRDDKFEKELKKVIFSHIPDEDRLNYDTLDELISYHSEIVMENIELKKNDISKLNSKIIKLESCKTEEYKKEIMQHLEQKRSELKAHLTVKPEEVKKPDDRVISQNEKDLEREIQQLESALAQQEQDYEKIKKDKITIKENLSKLERIVDKLDKFQLQYDSLLRELEEELTAFSINIKDVLIVQINMNALLKKKEKLETDLSNKEKDLDPFEDKSLCTKIEINRKKLKGLQEQLDRPRRLYKEYLSKLKQWEDNKSKIIGTPFDEGTIKYYEGKLLYLDEKLGNDLRTKREERLEKVKEIFKEKEKLKKTFKSLYRPVKKFVLSHNASKPEHQVQFKVSLGIKEKFPEIFLSYINQKVKGSFYGIDEGKKFINDIIDSTNFDEEESTIEFLRIIIHCLECDTRGGGEEERELHHQIGLDILLDFYNFLFSLDYIEPYYKLKFGDKDLSLLSPGEKGALILIFYLLIDKDDIPLIMDQPEENLDNQSVYELLVDYIKEAKKRRQIIIATHNPNLAVVCDSEQIIYSDISKFTGCKVTYTSGSIENPTMNDKVVKVLEGTMPAFRNRDRKYIEQILKTRR